MSLSARRIEDAGAVLPAGAGDERPRGAVVRPVDPGRFGGWPEYLAEAAGLGLFMMSASFFGVMLEHPDFGARGWLEDPLARRALMGLAMGLTALAIIYSPWGRRSGAHLNPAVTLTFLGLGKVSGRDAVAYLAAQATGGILGMKLAGLALGAWLAHPAVNFVVTTPGDAGWVAAFGAEVGMAFVLMSVVLAMSSTPSVARWTGVGAATCVFLFITFEAPLSGMSLNPSRTLASAVVAGEFRAFWIYLVAPPAGMWLAAWVHGRGRCLPVPCAKLHHVESDPCLFCEFQRWKVRRAEARR